MDKLLCEYVKLSRRSEDLKSNERVLTTALANLKEVKSLLIEKEHQYIIEEQKLRLVGDKEALAQRCQLLIDHLLHYQCIVECLTGDLLAIESSIIDDDEFVNMTLNSRQTEQAVLKAIKTNRQIIKSLDQYALSDIENKWQSDHNDRCQLVTKLVMDQNQIIVDKIKINLEQQQALLNHRYQSINSLLRMSFSH